MRIHKVMVSLTQSDRRKLIFMRRAKRSIASILAATEGFSKLRGATEKSSKACVRFGSAAKWLRAKGGGGCEKTRQEINQELIAKSKDWVAAPPGPAPSEDMPALWEEE